MRSDGKRGSRSVKKSLPVDRIKTIRRRWVNGSKKGERRGTEIREE